MKTLHLARGQLAGIDNFVRLLHRGIVVRSVERGARQCHKPGAGRFENAKGSDELEERIYPGWFRRPKSRRQNESE
jgi:hypothetical protein